jgi:uncharacterized protein DUF4279
MTARSRTKRANGLATSTAKSEQSDAISAFATLRFAGDRLDPDQISHILNIKPTKSIKKGEKAGKGGLWYLSTDKFIPGNDLTHHLTFLLSILLPAPGDVQRLTTLRDLVKKRDIEAHVTCFWHGKFGMRKPVIPSVVPQIFNLIPADIETDFDTEEAT